MTVTSQVLPLIETVRLFRPVGPEELELIRQSGWKSFPGGLLGQPAFYPVLRREYAQEIAQRWARRGQGAAYVVQFCLPEEYLERFAIHQDGGPERSEYWIPTEKLGELNARIEGWISLVDSYQPARPRLEVAGEPDQ